MKRAFEHACALAGLLLAGAVLTACGGAGGGEGGGAPKEVSQSSICSITSPENIKDCLEGQLMWLHPERWGNEQMPLLIVAAYCDTNHQVIMNNSGVVCAHTRKRLTPDSKAEK